MCDPHNTEINPSILRASYRRARIAVLGLLASTSVFLAEAATVTPVVDTGLYNIQEMSLDPANGDIYLNGFPSGSSELSIVKVSSGSLITLYSTLPGTTGGNLTYTNGFAVHGSDLWWNNANAGPGSATEISHASKAGSGMIARTSPFDDLDSFSSDGMTLFTAYYAGHLFTVDPSGFPVIFIGFHRGTSHLAIAADGGVLHVADDSGIYRRNADGSFTDINNLASRYLTNGSRLGEGGGYVFALDRTLHNGFWKIDELSGVARFVTDPNFTNLNAIAYYNGSLFAADTGELAAQPNANGHVWQIDGATGPCATYIGSFTQFQNPSAQAVQDWLNFRANLTPGAYDTATISGTFDPVGRTLTDPVIVPQIAAALQNGTAGSWTAGGFTWSVGLSCGPGTPVDLNVNPLNDTSTCACTGTGSYIVRPEIANLNWGGVNTATCSSPSQTITVTFCGPASTPTASCVMITVAVQDVAITPITMTGSGGVGGPYTFSATGLPNGLGISSSGTISGTPTVNGTFNYTVTVTDSGGHNGTVDCSVTVNPPPTATCATISGAVQGFAITPVTMTGSGGVGGPYTFSATGLPNGLGISSSGTISGTPTVNGTFNYTVTVTDSAGNSRTVNCSVTVNPPPTTSCVTIMNAAQDFAITPVTMTGSGGVGGPYTFSATGLPNALGISSSGTISGTPTVNGTFNYMVTVTDSAGNSRTVNCSVTVNPPLTTNCAAITAVQGAAITPVTMTGSGGVAGPFAGPYTFSATGLPTGLSISTSGTISGTPTVHGTYNYTVTVTDSGGHSVTVNCSVVVGKARPSVSTTASVDTTLGGSISDMATVSGGVHPTGTVTFRLFGPNDPGCVNPSIFTVTKSIDGNGQASSGSFTPTLPGTYIFAAAYNGDDNNDSISTDTGDETVVVSGVDADGSGSIAVHGGQATFSFSDEIPRKKGPRYFNYSDPAYPLSFSTKSISLLNIMGNHASFTGTAKLGKKGPTISFTVNVYENGPGSADQFSISVSNGYSASGNLTSGNIFIH